MTRLKSLAVRKLLKRSLKPELPELIGGHVSLRDGGKTPLTEHYTRKRIGDTVKPVGTKSEKL